MENELMLLGCAAMSQWKACGYYCLFSLCAPSAAVAAAALKCCWPVFTHTNNLLRIVETMVNAYGYVTFFPVNISATFVWFHNMILRPGIFWRFLPQCTHRRKYIWKKKSYDPRQFLICNMAGNYSWQVKLMFFYYYDFTFIKYKINFYCSFFVFFIFVIKMLLSGFSKKLNFKFVSQRNLKWLEKFLIDFNNWSWN